MSAVLSPPPGSRPCIACGRLPRWAGEANDAEGFCPGCLDPEGSETGLTPAEFFEAGRLAAIRAEVEREAEQLERLAKRAPHYADMLVLLPTQAHPYQVAADRYAARAADCRRWLQETA